MDDLETNPNKDESKPELYFRLLRMATYELDRRVDVQGTEISELRKLIDEQLEKMRAARRDNQKAMMSFLRWVFGVAMTFLGLSLAVIYQVIAPPIFHQMENEKQLLTHADQLLAEHQAATANELKEIRDKLNKAIEPPPPPPERRPKSK